MANPALEESLRICFLDTRGKRYLLVFLAGICLLALAAWPGMSPSRFIRFGRVPTTFAVTSIILVAAIAYIAARFGVQQTSHYFSIREWFTMTPVNPAILIIGKTLGGIAHTAALVLLALPVLLVTAAPSGGTVSAVLASASIMFSVSLLIRSFGLAVISVNDRSMLISNLAMWTFILAIFLATLRPAPEWNPIIVLQSAQSNVETVLIQSFRYTAVSLIIDVVAYVFLAVSYRKLKHRASE